MDDKQLYKYIPTAAIWRNEKHNIYAEFYRNINWKYCSDIEK